MSHIGNSLAVKACYGAGRSEEREFGIL